MKFYDEVTKVGELVPGKSALRIPLLDLSKDMPVKWCANRGELNLPLPKQSGNHGSSNLMPQLINLTPAFCLVPAKPWGLKLQRCVMWRAILPALDFLFVFEHLWMATVRSWVKVLFGHMLFFPSWLSTCAMWGIRFLEKELADVAQAKP